jgi:hypothetical protein
MSKIEELRDCVFSKRVRVRNDSTNSYDWHKIDINAKFHCWSNDSNGEGGQCPVGILELENGSVEIVHAELIKFVR